jgi:FlaA1/EpsC-like NDP-sugar epimerase
VYGPTTARWAAGTRYTGWLCVEVAGGDLGRIGRITDQLRRIAKTTTGRQPTDCAAMAPPACQEAEMKQMVRFVNRTALVTGGGSGVGAAVVARLAAKGAHVVVADVDLDAALGVAGTVRSEGGSAVPAQVDVRDRRAVARSEATGVDAVRATRRAG